VVLNTGNLVRAQQFLCGGISEPTTPVVVISASGPRPFYVVGHNPNTISEVKDALNAGANAIEPDVNVFESDPTKLCISHSGGDAGDPSLVQFLTDLHTVALQNPQLALIVFDCKPDTTTPSFGLELLNAIRTNLTFDIPLNVILSVSSLPNANYELAIHTGDVHMGGTDSNVTFTVTGSAGSIVKVIDTSLDGRVERNDWNYVTIPSLDLGNLISITVQRDNSGNGPDWFLDRIVVASFRYGVSKQATFNRWIDTTSPFTQPLV
jgi:PLAT/LH2 domain